MPKSNSETALATQVEDLFNRFGWKWMHIKPSIMKSGTWASSMNPEGKGWLDYAAVRPPRFMFVELKDAYGKMTPAQEEWWDAWDRCQKGVLVDPLARKGNKVSTTITDASRILTIPELYLWRPKDLDKIVEVLR